MRQRHNSLGGQMEKGQNLGRVEVRGLRAAGARAQPDSCSSRKIRLWAWGELSHRVLPAVMEDQSSVPCTHSKLFTPVLAEQTCLVWLSQRTLRMLG